VPGATIDFISAPRVADDGTLLVLMQWDDPVTSFTTFGFFVDGQLVVQTYATQGDGVQLTYLNNTALSYDLAPDGSRFSFVAYPWTGGWGAYEVPTGPWQSLGNGLAGTAGATPSLFPLGSLEVGEPVSLELAGALPGSSTALIIGTSTVNAPFKGGVLVPSPELVLAGLPLDGSGALTLAATFPPGLPSGVSLAFQFWTVDAGAPAGFSASNAVEGTTP
jgi:hypothetical protein